MQCDPGLIIYVYSHHQKVFRADSGQYISTCNNWHHSSLNITKPPWSFIEGWHSTPTKWPKNSGWWECHKWKYAHEKFVRTPVVEKIMLGILSSTQQSARLILVSCDLLWFLLPELCYYMICIHVFCKHRFSSFAPANVGPIQGKQPDAPCRTINIDFPVMIGEWFWFGASTYLIPPNPLGMLLAQPTWRVCFEVRTIHFTPSSWVCHDLGVWREQLVQILANLKPVKPMSEKSGEWLQANPNNWCNF